MLEANEVLLEDIIDGFNATSIELYNECSECLVVLNRGDEVAPLSKLLNGASILGRKVIGMSPRSMGTIAITLKGVDDAE